MIPATAWNNGQHSQSGSGYGLKISSQDRNQYFRREWGTVKLRLDATAAPIVVNIDKASFWNDTCRELISADLGRWLLANRFAPWPTGKPPRFTLIPREARIFDIRAGVR
jgi:hypothetical protein